MTYPRLMLLELLAFDKTQSALATGGDEFKVEAFTGLAYWMLSRFALHPQLQELQATAVYRTLEARDEQLLEVQHHLKLSAIGADVGLNDPAALEELLARIAPVRFLGEGSITLKADDPLVREFIAALDAGNDDRAQAVIFLMATRLVPSLGKLALVHRLNSFF